MTTSPKNIEQEVETKYEYTAWQNMKQRCLNKNRAGYRDYGGRGITVCDRWLHSFPNFLEDMGRRPDGMTLDRKDGNKGYTPDNCRWATYEMQNFNQRKKVNNKSGIVGVGWSKANSKWRAFIGFGNQTRVLGHYADKDEAAKVRKEAEEIFYGEVRQTD